MNLLSAKAPNGSEKRRWSDESQNEGDERGAKKFI
jgi:hypothetical protein